MARTFKKKDRMLRREEQRRNGGKDKTDYAKSGDEVYNDLLKRHLCSLLTCIASIVYIVMMVYLMCIVPSSEDEVFPGANSLVVGVYGILIICCGTCIHCLTNGKWRKEQGLAFKSMEAKLQHMEDMRAKSDKARDRDRRRKTGAASIQALGVGGYDEGGRNVQAIENGSADSDQGESG